MGRSRSRSRSRSRDRRRDKRPADDFYYAYDYDRHYSDRRSDYDYRSARSMNYKDHERAHNRSRSRSRDRDRSHDRDRRDRRKDRPAVDEFGRVINYNREKSISPDRPRKFDPRKLRRSESPDPVIPDNKHPPNGGNQFKVTPDDDPETAAMKMELEAMAKMGLPVNLDTTKGKGCVQSDKYALTGMVRIKPQRQARQYMNRRCGFNKPLPAESTRQLFGIGTKDIGVKNVAW